MLRGERNDHKGWRFCEEPIRDGFQPRVRVHDQIHDVLALLKTSPSSRRMVVSAWNPDEIHLMKLPPCHCMFAVNVQNAQKDESILVTPSTERRMTDDERARNYEQRLCLHLTQRSADIALGVPYNIASYALLMHLLSRFSGIPVGTFSHTLVDAHAYTSKPDGSKAEFDHVPGLREQLKRELRKLPTLRISDDIKTLEDVERLMGDDVSTEEVMRHFILEGYDPHPAISFKVAV